MCILRKNGMAFGVLVSLALLIHGCGSGGGGGGGNAPAGTAAQSASAASKAIVSALGVATDSGGDGDIAKAALNRKAASILSNEAQVRQALDDFKASVALRRQKTLRETTDSGDLPCPDGGMQRIRTDDNNTPDDESDDSFTANFVNCSGSDGDSTLFFNGSMRLTFTNGGQEFTLTFNRFTRRVTEPSGTFETFNNGTVSFSGREVECGSFSFLEMTFTMDMNGTVKVDLENNGTFEINESFSFNDFVMVLAETHAPEPDCTPGATIFTMNGKSTFTNRLNRADNITATFTHFAMVVTPATRTLEGIDREGETLSFDGTVAISSDCVDGTFTFTTPVGEEPFIPLDASCPVDGKILVNRGGVTTAVIYTSTGVQIDEGDDSSAEQTFDDCEAAEACV